MIGFYDYTVVVTYISLVSSIVGMFCAIDGKLTVAVFCLAFSGLCDMFDGKIARTKKDRTDDEKSFGIQIDSLCDIVCFGIFPIILGYKLGMCKFYSVVILALYGLAGVIRLAYFNVMEAKQALVTESGEKFYKGLPITSMAIVLPLVFMIQFFVPDFVFRICLHLALFIVGLLFVVDFKLKKPGNKTLALLVLVVGAAVIIMMIFTKYKVNMQMNWPWLCRR